MTKKKLQYDVVLTTGKSARALKRKRIKYEIGLSPLGKMRSRQERKAMAKSLKVPFNPRYNGVITKMCWKLTETKEGSQYTKLVLEAR